MKRDALRQQLIALADPGYRDFSAALLPGVEGILGVRMPLLRRLAREVLRGDWRSWLDVIAASEACVYEERMLQGLVISLAPCSIDERLKHTARFVPMIDNWAVCDCFCRKLRPDERSAVWPFIQPYFRAEAPYAVRFAVVTALQNFTDAAHIDELLDRLGAIRHDHYYVRMAVAWAVAECYTQIPDPTLAWLSESCPLDDWTYNKALQKIIESRRITPAVRQQMRQMKRRKRR